jgi:hypothetical protein
MVRVRGKVCMVRVRERQMGHEVRRVMLRASGRSECIVVVVTVTVTVTVIVVWSSMAWLADA